LPRNPVIAKLFRCAKLADNAGYGFDKMLKWEKSTHTKVGFENSVDVALVTFKINSVTIENNTENNTENLSKNQKIILDEIKKNPRITSEDLSIIIGITADNVRVNLSKLKSKNLIERIGPDKGGYWRVKS